jgi:hypothetical protein
MQPLDVGIFSPMKAAWRKELKKYADLDLTAKLLKKGVSPYAKGAVADLKPKKDLSKALDNCRLSLINRQKVLDTSQASWSPRDYPQPGLPAAQESSGQEVWGGNHKEIKGEKYS